MHLFHSNLAELYINVKYRSSSILVIICQILAELWPFFDLVFVGVLIVFVGMLILVSINNFCRDALILLKVCRRIYHCKVQVSFDIGNHPQNFEQVMALFRLSFCCWSKIQGKNIVSSQ